MKIPLSWLKEYVDINVPAEELARRLTMAGTEVAEVATIGGWNDCFVGHVDKVEPHPNADRLTLCTVNTGSERMSVVCGAPNVAQGQKIAFARVGAELFNAHSGKHEKLKAARIRGVVSEGMVCSELELGLGDDHAGILILPEDAPVGTPLSDYLGDQILDLEVTPNRPECLSVLGVAHEVAALTGTSVREPSVPYPEEGESIGSRTSVEIADPDLCRRYTATLVDGVKLGPSPKWLQDRLTRVGMRPISNVVDITNYVMLEYNQPLHAFDFDTLHDRKVVVRRARPGEGLVTLDGVDRRLSSDMLVIADSQKAVGLGGVIGGARSEMTEKTTTVLLESATFDAVNNRRTAQALGLSTEATLRFEKNLRPELAPIALRRATQLIQEIAGGVVAQGTIDVFPSQDSYVVPTVVFSVERLKKVLGAEVSLERVRQVLSSLGFGCEARGDDALFVTVPYWRSDISIEDDLIEEVARIVGYDEVPTTMLSTPIPPYRPEPLRQLRERLRDLLVAAGMQEVITYPTTSPEDLRKAKAPDITLQLANPMSSQQQDMRTTLRSGLLNTLAANLLHEHGPVAIFESGRIYLPRKDELPEERELVAGVFSGPRWEAHWLAGEGNLGFYDAKGVVEKVLGELGVPAVYEPIEDPVLHPSKGAHITSEGVVLGLVGEVHPAVIEDFGVESSHVAMFELDVERLLSVFPREGRRYSAIGRFPSASRDLSIVVDRSVPAGAINDIISGHTLVDEVALFDVYTGGNIPEGKRSLAYHVSFRSLERTLTAEEVNVALGRIVDSLRDQVQAELRT